MQRSIADNRASTDRYQALGDDTCRYIADAFAEYAADFARAIAGAFGEYAASDTNPGGGVGFYLVDEKLPYRVRFNDEREVSAFATPEHAVAAARAYRAEMRGSRPACAAALRSARR